LDELIEYSFHKKEDEDTTKQPEHLSVFLTTSYRGHPALLYMPSHLFYFDKLRSVHAADWKVASWCAKLRSLESQSTLAYPCQDKQYSWPIRFCGVKGHDTSAAVESFWESNSWSNIQEVRVVVEAIQRLYSQGVSTQSIGVMTAFRAQVVLVQKRLRQQGLGSVNVDMVEDYQAVEWDVIILSLTRSSESFLQSDVDHRAGLFQQPKRVNVALTRSENLLLVIGNPTTMRNDPIWSKWLDFCRQNGLWYGEKCSNKENDAKEVKGNEVKEG
jgi:superfamily I DNA and/or RNA helicase